MTDYFNYLAAVTAATLRQGRAPARISALLAFLGLIIIWIDIMQAQLSLALASQILLLASVGSAVIQAYYAARVNFDRYLFGLWAKSVKAAQPVPTLQGPTPDQEQFDNPNLKQLDTALIHLTLRKEAPPRSLDARARGAIGLLKWQLLALAVQIVLFALATVINLIN